MSNNVVVAIDGPSGSGKSSTSRGVATQLGLRYLDTGAMFRAVTWWMLEHGIDVNDPAAVAAAAEQPMLVSGTDPSAPTIVIGGRDAVMAIRTSAVTAAVSAVSAVPEVRARLLDEQRRIIAGGGIVVEGRDIGSVVVPDAPVKVFLTAAPAERALRRSVEEGGSDRGLTETALLERDRIDSARATAPLIMADGAHHIDTTAYSLETVVAMIVDLVVAVEGVSHE